ncbi:MAG: sugar transferase, partial [Candidatus Acidiferrales bacterium]
LVPAGLIAIRCMAWWLVKSWLRLGPARRVVIVGSGRVARELANKIAGHPEMMIEVVGFLFPSDAGGSMEPQAASAGATTVRTLNALELLHQKQVKELILAEQLPSGPESEKLIASCHRAGMLVHLVPQWYELSLSKARLTEIDDVPMVSIEARRLSDAALAWKRVMDLAIGVLLFVMAAPVLGTIAIVLRWKKGHAFKSDLRCGLNGAPFQMYRFSVDRWAKNLVGFEKFLARFSITELPQLLNVVHGEMSLVGPRPESPDRVKHYSAWQRQRLSVKPGVTGLAQVYGLREQHSSEEKAHFDLQYIYHWSLFFDFSLLLQTAWTLMFRLLEGKRRGETALPEPLDSAGISIREGLHADRS